ncbi:antibiotic biosynthesis monooxygenase family protein [Mesorhizobium metallidurans]|uniref:antibiotic biosynthesis monooxygenase family protein n=1 Tax=Mesorhizobium metallidurans TaxID=489722 RepID=UPI0009FCA38B
MARQPGFISIRLHRSLDGRRIVNYVQWQNRDLLRSAHQSPEFRKEWGHFRSVDGQDRSQSVRGSPCDR